MFFFFINLCLTCFFRHNKNRLNPQKDQPTEKNLMHKLCPTLTDCICKLSYFKKNLCTCLSVVQHIVLLFVHFKPFAFFFFFCCFSFFFTNKIFHPIFQPAVEVLLQSRFQTPSLSIPVQQEAQEACCVGAGCERGKP